MSIIIKPFTFSVGAVIVASQHNSNLDTIYSDHNGNITTVNLSPTAGIVDSQLAQITTTNKVAGTALTTLNTVPSASGALPSKNGGTGADLSSSAQGAVPYFSATGVESALPPGSSGQVIASQGAAANPQFVTHIPSILDYGSSASVSTAKLITGLLFAYGLTPSISGNSTQAFTNLPFTNSTSYQVCLTQIDGPINESPSVVKNSGSQFTVTNQHNDSRQFNWIAIGT